MKHFLPVLFLVGLLASAFFSLFGYGAIAENLGSHLVTDRYDDLARGIVEFGTLAYHPDPSSTVARAPLYPLLLAASMAVAGSRYAILALALQSLLHGLITLLAAVIALRLSGRKAALVTGIICAFHPLLLWYSGRLVIETLSTSLFTLIVLAAVIYWQKPSAKGAALTGLAIGLGLWCKAVFAPLLIALPFLILLRMWTPRSRREALALAAAALLVIAPWLVRNYILTGRWPLLQALAGYNLYVSDSFVDNAGASPFGYAGLIERIDFEGMNRGLTSADSSHGAAWLESRQDLLLTRRSLDRYLANPPFLLEKVALNAVWIWTLASSWKVSLFVGLLQVCLLAAVVVGVFRCIRSGGWTDAAMVPVWLGAAYLLPHLPVFALARFSVPPIPALLAVAVSLLVRSSNPTTHEL